MIRFLKEGFRYRLAGITMLICFVLSMTASYYGITIYKNMVMEEKENNDYRYDSEVFFTMYPEERFVYPHIPEGAECNLKIINFLAYLDSGDCTHLVDIIVDSYEENIPLVSGRYAEKKELESGEAIVILGRTNAKQAYEKDGELYYKILGEEYRVIGIAGARKSVIYDGVVMLYKDCLGENMRKELQNSIWSGYDMVLQSNQADCAELYHGYVERRFPVELVEESMKFNNTAALDEEERYCAVIYLFCFICLSVSLKLYIIQRSKEMQICKACGFSNTKILWRVIEPLLSVGVVSIILFVATVVIFNTMMGEFAEQYRLGFSLEILGPYVGIFLLAVMITGAIPVYKLLRRSIVQSMNSRR